MNFKSRSTELTPSERRAYAALPRDTHIDDAEEERTIRLLRSRGVFGPRVTAKRGARAWWRATAIVSAAAAGVVAVLQAARLRSTDPNASLRDTIARADTHTNATEHARAAAPGSDQHRQEKTSLLVWY